MPHLIRVRDVVRGGTYDFGPAEPMLRSTYELFQTTGPLTRRGALVDWQDGDDVRWARAIETTLGDAHPGERVLLRLEFTSADEARDEETWWLCDVEAVDGLAADL